MTYAGRGSDQAMIRFPHGMRDEIAAAAKANGRSMNAEIIARLSGDHALRDWFAGKALAGLMSATDREGLWTASTAADNAARIAYQAADAMLAARKGGDA